MKVPAPESSGDPLEIACPTSVGILEPATSVAGVASAPTRFAMRRGLPPRALQRVRAHVEAHLERTIAVGDLAAIAGLSTDHFARAFKQSEGVSPHSYLLRRRVLRAQELLANTDLPLSRIAYACGFSDQGHLARRFREHFGVTPSWFRWSLR